MPPAYHEAWPAASESMIELTLSVLMMSAAYAFGTGGEWVMLLISVIASFLTCTECADWPSGRWLALDQSVTAGFSSHWQWQEACCPSSVHLVLKWRMYLSSTHGNLKKAISKIWKKTSKAVIVTAKNTYTDI